VTRRWTTDRLRLSQAGPGDAGRVREYGLRSREFHRAWDPVRPNDYWELAAVERRLSAELDQAAQDRGLVVYLTPHDDERIIGRVAFSNIVRGAYQGCTVGYGLEPGATGRGYMTEALLAMVRVAFDELALHRVEANVVPRNARSMALVERCGFEREGLSPKYLRIAGRWEDHVRFARRNHALEVGE